MLLEKKILFVLTVLIAIGSTAFIYTQFNGDNDDDGFSLIDKILSSSLVRNSLFYPDSTITKDAFKIGQVGALMASSQPDLTLPDLYTRVEKSVVQITGRAASNTDLLSRGNARLGSGFVYDDNGHIITNNHVVAGSEGGKEEEEDFDVTFLDGTIYRAKLIGADPSTDLAVLYVEDVPRDKLVPLPLSNSSRLRVGEQVAAIGNPFGLSGSMTEGVISGLGRLISPDPLLTTQAQYSIPDVIQTDAAINPGNSGGPLLNMRGEVIGINSVIFSSTGSFAGVGFAIPSNTINKITPSLITKGSFAHPWLGISGSDMTPYIAAAIELEEPRGFLVMDVVAGSPADKAGIQGGNKITNIDRREIALGGDVILQIDNKIVRKIDDILTYLEREKTVGDSVKLTVLRDGNIQEINVRLGERPNSQQSP